MNKVDFQQRCPARNVTSLYILAGSVISNRNDMHSKQKNEEYQIEESQTACRSYHKEMDLHN